MLLYLITRRDCFTESLTKDASTVWKVTFRGESKKKKIKLERDVNPCVMSRNLYWLSLHCVNLHCVFNVNKRTDRLIYNNMECGNERERTRCQFVIVSSLWIHSYFDNVMTKSMINNRREA